MIRRTLKLAWFKRNRYALTVVAIALSVAFIVSTLLLTTSIADVGEPLRGGYQGVDAVVTGPEVAAGDGPVQAISAPVPATVVAELEDAGYTAVGFSDPYAQILAADGTAGGQDQAASNVAEPWLGDSPLNAFAISNGRAPDAGEAVLDESTAGAAGLDVGDALTFVTETGVRNVSIVGLATFGGADNDPYTSTVLLPPDDAIFETTNGFSRILVADGDDAASLGAIADRAPGMIVQTGTEWIADEEAALNDFLGFFSTFLTVFAVVAVVVGMVIVTNTFTVSLSQRTQELALLRLVGTTRRQLLAQVVLEAVLLGAAGTIAGILLGLAGVSALGWFLDVLGLVIERSNTTSPTALAIGVIVGLGVTVVASVRPAWKSTAVAPIEALRSSDAELIEDGNRRRIFAGLLAAIGVGLLVWGITQADIIYTGAAIGAIFLALYLGADSLVRTLARITRPILGSAGPTGTIASRNLERNAGRTSAAASALMIGISLIGFFTLMAATIGQFIAGDAGDALRADLVVQGIGSRPEPALSDAVLASIEGVPGVDIVVPVYQTSVTPTDGAEVSGFGPGGGGLGTAITDIDDLTDAFEFEVNQGSLDDVGGQRVVIDQATADGLSLTTNDTFAVTSLAGETELQVVAIVETSLPGSPQPAIIGALDLADTLGYTDPATVAYVVGAAPAALINDAIGLPTVETVTRDSYIDGLSSNLDTILALVYALLAVAVIVALIGIANTVSLAISERVGEIAATRAAGASSRQIFWSLLAEFGLLALVGIASGLAFAWVAAAALFNSLSAGQIAQPETDLTTGLLIVAAGLGGALGASWFPARSAATTDILDVLRAD